MFEKPLLETRFHDLNGMTIRIIEETELVDDIPCYHTLLKLLLLHLGYCLIKLGLI